MKLFVILLAALLSIGIASAVWLDPPTDIEKQYFKDNLKNLSEKEFGAFGVAIGDLDVQTSVYVYKRQTLTTEEWNIVFKDAFATDPSDWTQVYDFVLDRIKISNYFETFGYLNIDNSTYWIENVDITDTSFEGDLTNVSGAVGTLKLNYLFWSFWTGNADINGNDYRIVVLKNKA